MKVFLSYKDETERIREGYVELLEENPNYLKFQTTGGNIITIPYSRLLKMKQEKVL